LEFCASRKEQPDKSLSGKLMLRMSPDLHRRLYQSAAKEGKSMNVWIVDNLERMAG
jgi:predicted HicB family RNase H-like nuclease